MAVVYLLRAMLVQANVKGEWSEMMMCAHFISASVNWRPLNVEDQLLRFL